MHNNNTPDADNLTTSACLQHFDDIKYLIHEKRVDVNAYDTVCVCV